MSSKTGKSLCVVAVDFGTVTSGYAYRMGDNKLFVYRNWMCGENWESLKTPTCILTHLSEDGTHKLVEFGYQAQLKYLENLANQTPAPRFMFDQFKIKLKGEIIEDNKISDKTETVKVEAIVIFRMALAFMKDHLLKNFENMGRCIANHFHWILTVPAIWSEDAKAFMRRAAYQAGLITEENSEQLDIVLEPEAASLYCRSIEMNRFRKHDVQNVDVKISEGTVYMIIDAGGGTVDIAVHEMRSDGNVNEVVTATGGDWGATNINTAFIKKIEDILGETFIAHMKEHMPRGWWELENKIEMAKRTASPSKTKFVSVYTLTMKLCEEYKKITGREISNCCKESGVDGAYLTDEYVLAFTHTVLDEIFKPVVGKIIECIEQLVLNVEERAAGGEVGNLQYVFMVGGFSCSPYLTNSVRDYFIEHHKQNVEVISADSESEESLAAEESVDSEEDNLQQFTNSCQTKKTLGVSQQPGNILATTLLRCDSQEEEVEEEDNEEDNELQIDCVTTKPPVTVLIPEEPDLAVLRGAVMFADNPSFIQERRSRKTYGMSCTVPFEPNKHDIRRKKTINGLDECEGVLNPFVRKGDKLRSGETRVIFLMPFQPTSTRIKMDFYQSSDDVLATKDVIYIDDPLLGKLRTINYPLGDVDKGLNRMIRVEISVGESEMKILVKETTNSDSLVETVRVTL